MLIGLSGFIGSGKSTVEQVMRDQGFLSYVLADPIKQIGLILGFTHQELYGTQADKLALNKFWQVSGRTFAQKFGTEIMRQALPEHIPEMDNIWIKLFAKYYYDHSNDNIVVPDVRFPDELEAIKSLGGKIIYIERETEWANTAQMSHASEQYNLKDHADHTIQNNGTLDDLHEKVMAILYEWD